MIWLKKEKHFIIYSMEFIEQRGVMEEEQPTLSPWVENISSSNEPELPFERPLNTLV